MRISDFHLCMRAFQPVVRGVRRPVLGLALVAGLLGASWAAAESLQEVLRADHPEVYEVREGDTLWDIAERFLEQPWFWPELWRVNAEIANPHLIYPGDRIRFVMVDGQPGLELERGEVGRTVRLTPVEGSGAATGSGTERLEPSIRAEPLAGAIPAIRFDAIRGFLSNSRVVAVGTLEQAPYVIQGQERRLLTGAGDSLYAFGDLVQRASYALVRPGVTYIDPDTDEVLGVEAVDIATGRVVSQERIVSTVEVLSARQNVRIGDRLLPTEERSMRSTFFPSPPKQAIEANIIAVAGGVSQVSQFDTVVINRGADADLEEGNVLAIFRAGDIARDPYSTARIRLPSERAGLLMIFRVFPRVAFGFVVRADRQLSLLDEVRSP